MKDETKMGKLPFKFRGRDRVITAFADTHSGPGWHNSIVWVIVLDGDGVYRLEAIQPEDQTEKMLNLFDVSRAAHRSMKGNVVRMLEDNR